jgi:hypothetical protein
MAFDIPAGQYEPAGQFAAADEPAGQYLPNGHAIGAAVFGGQ